MREKYGIYACTAHTVVTFVTPCAGFAISPALLRLRSSVWSTLFTKQCESTRWSRRRFESATRDFHKLYKRKTRARFYPRLQMPPAAPLAGVISCKVPRSCVARIFFSGWEVAGLINLVVLTYSVMCRPSGGGGVLVNLLEGIWTPQTPFLPTPLVRFACSHLLQGGLQSGKCNTWKLAVLLELSLTSAVAVRGLLAPLKRVPALKSRELGEKLFIS